MYVPPHVQVFLQRFFTTGFLQYMSLFICAQVGLSSFAVHFDPVGVVDSKKKILILHVYQALYYDKVYWFHLVLKQKS